MRGSVVTVVVLCDSEMPVSFECGGMIVTSVMVVGGCVLVNVLGVCACVCVCGNVLGCVLIMWWCGSGGLVYICS